MLRQSQYWVALAVTLGVLVGAAVFVGSRFHGAYQAMDSMTSCEESNQGQTLSPDRRYIATVFVRDCGATTGYVTHVNLRKATDVFMADRGGVIATGQVVTIKGVALVTAKWAQKNDLEVQMRGAGVQGANVAGSWNDVVVHAADGGVP